MDRVTGSHCLVRAASDDWSGPSPDPVGPDELNRLLMARDAEGLVEALMRLGPLYDEREFRNKRCSVRCVKPLGPYSDIGEPDPDLLLRECYLDPFAEPAMPPAIADEFFGRLSLPDGFGSLPAAARLRFGGYVPLGRPRMAAAERACERYGIRGDLDPSSPRPLVAEPLSDWVLIRNLLSIVLRIAGVLRVSGDGGDVLRSAGFTRVGVDTGRREAIVESPCHVIPVASSASHISGGLREILERGPIRLLRFPSPGVADGERVGALDDWWYLALEEREGRSELRVANDMLGQLDASIPMRGLRYLPGDGISLSGESGSFLAAAWSLVREHPGRYPMTCQYCGRTVLSTMRGPGRRFCSDSCRVSAGRLEPEGAEGSLRGRSSLMQSRNLEKATRPRARGDNPCS